MFLAIEYLELLIVQYSHFNMDEHNGDWGWYDITFGYAFDINTIGIQH